MNERAHIWPEVVPLGAKQSRAEAGAGPRGRGTQGSRSIQLKQKAEQEPWLLDPPHHYNPGVVLLTPTPSSTSKELRKHFWADKMQRP